MKADGELPDPCPKCGNDGAADEKGATWEGPRYQAWDLGVHGLSAEEALVYVCTVCGYPHRVRPLDARKD